MNVKNRIIALCMMSILGGCGGSRTSSTGSLPQTVPAQLAQAEARAASEPLTQAATGPQYAPSSADLLYVGNTANNSITVYHHDASGNSAPLYVIAGSKTQISSPGQLSQDATGDLYVANGDYSGLLAPSKKPAILVFAHGANGNVAPIRELAGPATGIHNVAAMTVDKATGKLFVVDTAPGTDGRYIDVSLLRFAPDATGNAVPFARSYPNGFPAYQLDSDSTGKNLLEAHSTNEPSNAGVGVSTIVKQFANNAETTTLYQTVYLFMNGVVDDPTTKTYLVTNGPAGIYRFAEDTVGVDQGPGGPRFSPPVVSVITSDTCGSQLSLGYLRNIYVSHNKALCPTDAVYVYAHDASGNAVPIRTLSGPATKLAAPYGLYEGE